MSTTKRVLGRVRLSRSSEESTSIERQREIVQQWAEANGHTVIGWAEDLDVSGSVSPFDAPSLGDWLTNRHPEFDVIACWKLDRLSRNTINLNRLIGWCLDHDKTIVSTTEGIDISTGVGRLIAYVIGFLAEGELDAIRDRTRVSRSKLRELARWPGGKPPFGYRAVRHGSGAGWRLEVDQHAAGIVDRIVTAYLGGASLTSIARTLTTEGVPTPAQYYKRLSAPEAPPGEWHITPLRKMLISPALRARLHHNGEVVRDDQGMPVQFADPLVTDDQWDRIQARFSANQENRRGTRQAQASPLSGLVTCLRCGQPSHYDTNVVKGKRYDYYRCRGGCPKLPADELETLAEETFMREMGSVEVRERIWVPGDSREAETREAVAALDELSQAAGRAVSATARERLQRQLDAIDARLAELEAAPAREARWEFVPTGQTYAQRWEASDTEGRRDMLHRSGITFAVRVIGGRGSKAREFEIRVPPEVRGNLG